MAFCFSAPSAFAVETALTRPRLRRDKSALAAATRLPSTATAAQVRLRQKANPAKRGQNAAQQSICSLGIFSKSESTNGFSGAKHAL